MRSRNGFTLIELLVVIAIIAILSVVVILTLNPAELLRQSRDSNRLSDLDTLNHAVSLYSTDQSSVTSFSLGVVSTTYISIPDPSATSTAGDQCQGLNLPALATSSGYGYHCASSSTYRNTDGTGWIPVNFKNLSSGSPLGNLPVDPVNQASSNLFYTYTTDGVKYLITSVVESQKYKLQLSSNSPIAAYPEVAANGTNFALSELYSPSGLIAYWPMDEGSGSLVLDQSANGNPAVWSGTQAGTNGYYSAPAKVGSYSGNFDGATDYISSTIPQINGSVATMSFWMYAKNTNAVVTNIGGFNYYIFSNACAGINGVGTVYGAPFPYSNQWVFVTTVFVNGNYLTNGSALYYNGVLQSSTVCAGSTGTATLSTAVLLGKYSVTAGYSFSGYLDDVHFYNRALSAAEVQALYNAEK